MDEIPNKLTGAPLSIEELVGNLPALKEVPTALLKNFATGAAVLRRFEPGEVVCREGEFGSTAFYIVSGSVDIYINNPLAHLQTKPKMFGLFSGMKSLLVDEATDKREKGGRQFITADASVDLPRSMPINQLGVGELFGEMTCRTFQPRAATVRATEECVMVEMLRVVLDMLVGSREVSAEVKARTKIKVPTFKGTSFKKILDDRYRERSLESHLRSVPILGGLSTAYLKTLTERAELVSVNKDEVICKQGDTADAFYLIRMGLVRVSQSMPGGEMVRTYLHGVGCRGSGPD
jgi:CRP-like cAMP-binding protein